MGEGNRKLSKRDPQAALNTYRAQGYLPEGLLNYLALLGWSIADDHDIFSLDEMVAAFDVADVNANPARFDPKKCLAINATHIRLLTPDDFASRLIAQFAAHGVAANAVLIAAAAPLVQERIQTLADGVELLRFLFIAEAEFSLDEAAAAKHLGAGAASVLPSAIAALEPLPDWTTATIEAALTAALIEGLGLKPRDAYTPIRVAVTGGTVSPPLFESLELLGRARALDRLGQAVR
jgi:glutamyl-tRNA synthetase